MNGSIKNDVVQSLQMLQTSFLLRLKQKKVVNTSHKFRSQRMPQTSRILSIIRRKELTLKFIQC
jgi:hypothetical protein